MTEAEKSDIFLEIHSGNPQEGPGNFIATQHAFSLLADLPSVPYILDVGCGPGRQTLDLSRLTDGHIIAIDNHAPFVDTLRQAIIAAGLTDRITTMQGDMAALEFEEQTFDLIWSEGAIYNIGVETGLRIWQPFLKKQRYLVFSELTWLRADAPEDARAFWREEYPMMQDIDKNLALIRQAGYRQIGHFPISESAWWDYYIPIEKRLAVLRKKYHANPDALNIVEREQQEIEMYRTYSTYYGYVFYLAQRP